MRIPFIIVALSVFLVPLSGCTDLSILLTFKNNATDAESVSFADPMLQQCWNDTIAEAKANVLPSPLGYWTVAQITNLNCGNYGITNASDISNASGAHVVNLADNDLSDGGTKVGSLDLGYMPFLNTLFADRLGVTYIVLSGAPSLAFLDLHLNPLNALDLSNNTALQRINLTLTNITDPIITNKPNLTLIELDTTPLQTLDVSGNPSLQILDLSDSSLDPDIVDALDVAPEYEGLCIIYNLPFEDPDCDKYTDYFDES